MSDNRDVLSRYGPTENIHSFMSLVFCHGGLVICLEMRQSKENIRFMFRDVTDGIATNIQLFD